MTGVGWGGRRPGAGRKSVIGRKMADHRARPRVSSRKAVHVTARMRPEIRPIGNRRVREVLEQCIAKAERRDFRILAYSIQRNHIHLLCRAKNTEGLSRGIQGLSIRIARNINRLMGRKGTVLDGRYHVEILDGASPPANAECFGIERTGCPGLTELIAPSR